MPNGTSGCVNQKSGRRFLWCHINGVYEISETLRTKVSHHGLKWESGSGSCPKSMFNLSAILLQRYLDCKRVIHNFKCPNSTKPLQLFTIGGICNFWRSLFKKIRITDLRLKKWSGLWSNPSWIDFTTYSWFCLQLRTVVTNARRECDTGAARFKYR